MPTYTYKPDENPKRKHAWKKPHAGFMKIKGVWIGKCPHGIEADLSELLDDAVPYGHSRDPRPHPTQLWRVYQGVPYRALPSGNGDSYHAFPACDDDWRRIPRKVRTALEAQATAEGTLSDLRRWLKRQPKEGRR